MRFKNNQVYDRERFYLDFETFEWNDSSKELLGLHNYGYDILTKDKIRYEIKDLQDCIKFLKEKLKEMK